MSEWRYTEPDRGPARRVFWAMVDRSTYTCADCGRAEHEVEFPFEVHHVDHNPENHAPYNLVGLCRPCHQRRHAYPEWANPAERAYEAVRFVRRASGKVADWRGE